MRNGKPGDELEGMQGMVAEGARMVEDAKQGYLQGIGHTLANPGTSRKSYWTLINAVLNKAKIPIIPPLLGNGLFITDFTEMHSYLMIISYSNAQPPTLAVRFYKIPRKVLL